MAQAFPIERYLVPRTVAGPPGFTKVEQPLRAGLPAAITLSPELSLVLTITTGLVKTWLELDPDIVVTQSFDQTIALPEGPEHDVGRARRRWWPDAGSGFRAAATRPRGPPSS
jgi:hypothetical protein